MNEPWDVPYTHENEWLIHRYPWATGNTLRFAARNIRKERSGTHAKVDISVNWVSLAWSDFNTDKDEDRVRLSNSAYNHLKKDADESVDAFALDRAEFSQKMFKHALDLFCKDLWDQSVSDLMGGQMAGDPTINPAQRLLADYILKDAGTILFGPPGATKSNTALTMAVSLAWGREILWPLYDSVVPLYINVERSERSMAARLARVNRALGLDPETTLPFLNARGKSLPDIYEAAKRTIKAEGCGMVWYDSVSRMGLGSLKEDDVANKSMDMLNALCPTWAVIGHTPRADETHVFGSMMFDAAADVTVQVRSQDNLDATETGVSLEVEKANDTAKGIRTRRVHVFEWEPDGLRGIRQGRMGEFAELDAAVKTSRESEVTSYLLRVGKADASQVGENIGVSRQFAQRLLAGMGTLSSEVAKHGQILFFVKAL